jgi:transcriptional regulator with XRE-family HTH domain
MTPATGDRPDNARVGQRVQNAREQLGWTQDDLATHADVSRSTIQSVERGESAGRRSIARIARALGLDHAALTAAPPPPPQPAAATLNTLSDITTADLVAELYRRIVAAPQAAGRLRVVADDGTTWAELDPAEQRRLRRAIDKALDQPPDTE